MKPNTVVASFLARINARRAAKTKPEPQLSSFSEVTEDMVDDHLMRDMYGAMTLEAQELFGTLSGDADQWPDSGPRVPASITNTDPRFVEAGFVGISSDDRLMIEMVFKCYGRPVAFTEEGLIVHPKVGVKRPVRRSTQTKAAA